MDKDSFWMMEAITSRQRKGMTTMTVRLLLYLLMMMSPLRMVHSWGLRELLSKLGLEGMETLTRRREENSEKISAIY